jgi:hypothetical protein
MVTYDPATIVETLDLSPDMATRLDTIRWEMKGQAVEKANLMILDLLATNNWKRPVYFVMTTGPSTYIGLDNYLHLEGLAYRLLPVKVTRNEGQIGQVNTAVMYDNLMNRFKWGNMNDPEVYIDETNARMVMNLRSLYGRLADALILEGKIDSAKKVLDLCFDKMPEHVVRYDYFTVPLINSLYKTGETDQANKISERLAKTVTEDLAFLFSFPDKDLKEMDMDIQEGVFTMQRLNEVVDAAGQEDLAARTEATLRKYYDLYVEKVYEP